MIWGRRQRTALEGRFRSTSQGFLKQRIQTRALLSVFSLDSAKRTGVGRMSWIEWASDWSGPVGRGLAMFPYKGLRVNMFIVVIPVIPAAVRAGKQPQTVFQQTGRV